MSETLSTIFAAQLEPMTQAVLSLPLAAGLAAALAFRPRRPGTPARNPPVIQTQITLAIIGAVVMLVVGSSLARAFGIVGVAGLVRYRARIENPMDAGVMLSTLAIGLASGVGLYLLAIFATVFLLGVIWMMESLGPAGYKLFALKVSHEDPVSLRPALETLFHNYSVDFELRGSSAGDLSYEVKVPWDRSTDRLSNAILRLDKKRKTAVEWGDKKGK